MQIIYQLSESELTYEFFRALKKTLKGKTQVQISISTEQSPYKMTQDDFEEMVLANESPEYVFEGDAFQEFTKKILDGEKVNLENYKREMAK